MPPRRRRRWDPLPVSQMVARYVRDAPAGRGDGGAPIDRLRAAWAEAAGADAARSLPVRWSRTGVVTVACRDASVAQSLAMRADVVIDALTRATDLGVRAVRPTIADHALPMTPEAAPPPPPPGRQAVAAAEGLAAGIEDPGLREAVARAAAASLQRNWSEGGARPPGGGPRGPGGASGT